jgi:hypothetical protein
MTQVTKFKCIACGRALQEEEYYVAYEELRIATNQIAKRILRENVPELEIDYLEEDREQLQR